MEITIDRIIEDYFNFKNHIDDKIKSKTKNDGCTWP